MNLDAQQLIIWAIIGIVAGWLASVVVGGGGGLLRYLITGLIGAFVGGFVLQRGGLEAQPRQRVSRAGRDRRHRRHHRRHPGAAGGVVVLSRQAERRAGIQRRTADGFTADFSASALRDLRE